MIPELNYPLGFNQKFEVIDYKLNKLQEEIDEGFSIEAAKYLYIVQNSNSGEIQISLLNYDHEIIDTQSITLTGKLINGAKVDYENKLIKFTCLDNSTIDCNISSLLDTLNNKVDKTTIANKIYGTNSNGQTTYSFDISDLDLSVGNFVRRNSNGNVATGTPISASDAATKAYTDVFAKTLTAEVNTTTYTLTFTLKDANNNIISTSTVDLPNENAITNASYDNSTKNLIFTRQNGNTFNVSIDAIINGLQVEINSSNKLNADLVDDTSSTHKFATAAQLAQIAANTTNIATKANSSDVYTKTQTDNLLDAKANVLDVYTKTAIDGLLDNYYSKADTNTLLSEKVNVEDVYIKSQVNSLVDTKQDKLSTQTVFTNKGSATKVAQISTNNLGQVINVNEVTIDALPSSTLYGATMTAQFVGSTSVLTITLKDQNNNILSTQNIDLGVQSVIVSGEYDSDTQSIILTLSSGDEITIPVTGLVSGLVPTSRTIAGIDLEDNITLSELIGATGVLFKVTDVPDIDED